MGAGLARSYPEARAVFEQADAVLGFPLSRLCFEGPEAELGRTENTQPALYTVSLAVAAVLERLGIEPAAAAGHSLGEYSALAAAGAIGFEEGLRLVRRRGEVMAAISASTPGGMAAILGLPAAAVVGVCREAAGGEVLDVANYNAPDQTVISGAEMAVARGMAAAKEQGAARVVRLNLSAPFHSRLMAGAAERLAPALAALSIIAPRVPVVANVTADYVRTPEAIRAALLAQLAGSVRWTETVLRLAADGVERGIEVGPGRVLAGLAKRIAPGLEVLPADEPDRVPALRDLRS
jgi:[acyl-carrier-protein] S-malonyltransferase